MTWWVERAAPIVHVGDEVWGIVNQLDLDCELDSPGVSVDDGVDERLHNWELHLRCDGVALR